MTKMIQIRNVPEDVHRELKARAARSGQTLSDYLKQRFEEIVATPSAEEIFDRLERHRVDVAASDIVAAIRSERPRR